jgi:hypothetical protein
MAIIEDNTDILGAHSREDLLGKEEGSPEQADRLQGNRKSGCGFSRIRISHQDQDQSSPSRPTYFSLRESSSTVRGTFFSLGGSSSTVRGTFLPRRELTDGQSVQKPRLREFFRPATRPNYGSGGPFALESTLFYEK